MRIFKTRTIATDACKAGKIKVNGQIVKPSFNLQRGELIEVKKNGFNFQFKVLDLLSKRVGAPIARQYYEDLTPAEELNKYEAWFIGKTGTERREKGAGRPTKRERREIDRFKTDWGDWGDFE